MVDNNLINELDIGDEAVDREFSAAFGAGAIEEKIASILDQRTEDFKAGTILKGRVVGMAGDAMVVDVGLKSEGVIPAGEWDDPGSVDPGDEVDVWLETVESDSGLIVLSKRKADRLLNWQRIVETSHEGDKVSGKVMRKIKGGLLVDIGVPVFLPASQVDIRRPGDLSDFIGRVIEAKILKIDTDRRNIVVSRRKLIEDERNAAKEKLLAEIEVGQICRGVVKNITDFGAFVDLGGIDGLLHITDMSWDRVGHPSEIVKIDAEIEVRVLNINREREKIALGLKQLKANPWESIEDRYPVGAKIKGEVVNIMNYGAFVKLEPGVEGLVHISEMSWTRRINHPSELLNPGEEIEVVVLDINKGKQEISLGIKQTEINPWTQVAGKYPPNTRVTGKVRNMTNYGVFVEIEEGIDGLLHVSDLSWTKKISHPSEVLTKGQEVECVVLKVEEGKQRIALGLKQVLEDPWKRAVTEHYIPGQIVEGAVTKITNFGVFVELEPDLEGLLHVSELADHKVEDPHNEVKVGERIQVKILRVDPVERKIGLSKKRAEWSAEQEAKAGAEEKRSKERRGGLQTSAETNAPLIDPAVVSGGSPSTTPEPGPQTGESLEVSELDAAEAASPVDEAATVSEESMPTSDPAGEAPADPSPAADADSSEAPTRDAP